MTTPTTTLPTSTELQQIEVDVESAFRCQWFQTFQEPGQCQCEATWLIKFRVACTHGAVLVPLEVLFCNIHKMMIGGGHVQCVCGCIILSPSHIVEYWRPIK